MVSHSFDRQNSSTNLGFSTKNGLRSLQEEIETTLKDYEEKISNESCLQHFRLAFVKRYDSPIGFFSILTTVVSVIGLFVARYYISSFILFLILSFDLFIVIRESNLRRTEIFRKTRKVLDEIRQAEESFCDDWDKDNYPHLCCPVSPCVSLQWTYRDNQIVNLPYAMLVKGDYIVMRPGQITPGPCYEVGGKRKFKANETYGVPHLTDPPTKPVARNPLPNLVCCLETTPYLDNLKIALEDFLKRPPTIYNQQRYLLVTKYIQQWGVISAFAVTFLVGILRLYGWALTDKDNPHNRKWRHLLLEGPISAILPILPLVFPVMWISMNLWGVARLDSFLRLPKSKWPNSKGKKSFEEDLDTPTYDYEDVPLQRANVFSNWLQLWKGDPDLLARSSNVVQVLGSVTALCCVDKKGILSWPNPTAEKVFFLHGAEEQKSDVSQTSIDTESLDSSHGIGDKSNEIVAEVLDLTHDQHCPFRLEFDDHEWKHYINSLKPLGLAILLNTCSPKTHSHYAQFCSHVTALGMLDKDLVPVTNRYAMVESSLNSFLHGRCLCELAKQIGFTTHATDAFTLEGQLATYRHLQPDVVRHDIRFARQFQFSSKVKVPFPHSLAVVLREFPGGSLSLFTQGTADIVLDCCDDFWDGKDLRPLSQHDRKRAQDFYQRNALTAYCTAFSYRPLRHGISGALSGSLNNKTAYLELPPESRCKMRNQSFVDNHNQTKLSHSISTDSLLFSETKDEEVAGVETCFEMQCHQVFIGMVTMQYQAQTDIVHLVECLERACIRFVHFSKENELRSRVFSEKMGLESGWNCHISLMSENNTTTNPNSPKQSANLDVNVKIDKNDSQEEQDLDVVETTDPLLLQPNLETSKTLSSSAPGAISNQDYNMMTAFQSQTSLNDLGEKQRPSQDSALDDQCRSLSVTSESTEHSAAFRFDMSNRAKLPRGIENIRPHLEKVDNVPLQVSLFTDCSAEATREMLSIMQSYGEIVVCMGSSASNANAEIFLQADCSIAVEPLYPQVCQDVPAYNENNIHNNKVMLYHLKQTASGEKITQQQDTIEMLENGQLDSVNGNTVSPMYISRLLNSLPCSISVCRDDPLSFVALIELSRRFSSGLWNCIQFWACAAVSLASLNIMSACLSLPPIFPPNLLLYLMCVPVPLIAISLAHIEGDPHIMNRATGKKQTKYDTKVFGYVVWCYGSKFVTPNLIVILAYSAFMAHPLEIIDITDNFFINLNIARFTSLFGIILHFAFISASFVHRDHTVWQKNPFSNKIWTFTVLVLLILHALLFILQVTLDEEVYREIPTVWTNVVFVLVTTVISYIVTEICKCQEIKLNSRYQRRARLDFGTKLGMNSPF